MNVLTAMPVEMSLQYPVGRARYLTDDPLLRGRLASLARELGGARDLGEGAIEIEIPRGQETTACLLFGSTLPEYDQERVYVVIDSDTRTVTTLRSLLSRCRYAWFSDLLANGDWTSHFQPIVRVQDRDVVAYEALLRTRRSDGEVIPPPLAVEAARATGLLEEFERRARKTALVNACSGAPAEHRLHINVDAGSINAVPDLVSLEEMVRGCGREPGDVVVEFLESDSLVQSTTVDWLRAELRNRGFLVALDDLTSGHSTLLVLERLRPDVAKLDRGLVTGAWSDRFRRRLVQAFVDLCSDLEIPLVVEGVETDDDFDFIRDLGVELAQGYLFDPAAAAGE